MDATQNWQDTQELSPAFIEAMLSWQQQMNNQQIAWAKEWEKQRQSFFPSSGTSPRPKTPKTTAVPGPSKTAPAPAQKMAEPVQEVAKPAQKVSRSAQLAAEPAQEVVKPAQEATPRASSKPAQEAAPKLVAKPVQETAKPAQGVARPTKEAAQPALGQGQFGHPGKPAVKVPVNRPSVTQSCTSSLLKLSKVKSLALSLSPQRSANWATHGPLSLEFVPKVCKIVCRAMAKVSDATKHASMLEIMPDHCQALNPAMSYITFKLSLQIVGKTADSLPFVQQNLSHCLKKDLFVKVEAAQTLKKLSKSLKSIKSLPYARISDVSTIGSGCLGPNKIVLTHGFSSLKLCKITAKAAPCRPALATEPVLPQDAMSDSNPKPPVAQAPELPPDPDPDTTPNPSQTKMGLRY